MLAQHNTCAQQDWTADTAGPGPGSSQAGANSGFTPQELKLRQQQRERRKSGLARKEQVIVPFVLERERFLTFFGWPQDHSVKCASERRSAFPSLSHAAFSDADL